MTSSPSLILASASPRRKELLAQLEESFSVCVSPFDEPQCKPIAASPRAWAAALAYFKARAVAEQSNDEGNWIIGADTIVECDGEVLGKPRDIADARRMLLLQAGRACDVITGVCLLRRHGALALPVRWIFIAVTRVWMRRDRAEIERYLASGEWDGKAGAYGIQDVGDRLIERVDGSFSNVMGLPMEMVRRMWDARHRLQSG